MPTSAHGRRRGQSRRSFRFQPSSCSASSRPIRRTITRRFATCAARAAAAAEGVVAGVALTVAAVVIGALVFKTYGYGIFVFAPFAVGAMTAYLANRRQDIGLWRTVLLVLVATTFGGLALIALAV